MAAWDKYHRDTNYAGEGNTNGTSGDLPILVPRASLARSVINLGRDNARKKAQWEEYLHKPEARKTSQTSRQQS